MKKTTAGALAAAAAGALLLGGTGSLAFWTDAETVTGTSVASGHLKLTTPDCGDGWTIDGGAAYTTQLLVPGDTLSKTCTFTVQAAGEHLTADFDVAEGTFESGAAALTDELVVTADYSVNGAPVGETDVPVVNGDVVTVDLEIDWPYGATADNDSNVLGGLSAALDSITITATQGHDNS